MRKYKKIIAALLMMATLAGCERVSDEPIDVMQDSISDSMSDNSSYDKSDSPNNKSTKETEPEKVIEINTENENMNVAESYNYPNVEPVIKNAEDYGYRFSIPHNAFLSETVFVGDSICSGLSAFEVLPYKKVCATGNVSANNIFTFTFNVYGEELSIKDALAALHPNYVVFSMGMNDVNMTTKEDYIENYRNLLSEIQAVLPDAKLIVASITPITVSSEFSSNDSIDEYNNAIKENLASEENWFFVDAAPLLKDESTNALKEEYNSGDGVHLSGAAYYAFLYQICSQVIDEGIYQP